jgi:hypothetical protein
MILVTTSNQPINRANIKRSLDFIPRVYPGKSGKEYKLPMPSD